MRKFGSIAGQGSVIFGACISGDYIAAASGEPLLIKHLITGDCWELPKEEPEPSPDANSPVGTSSYFWDEVGYGITGLLQIDAIDRTVERLEWAEDIRVLARVVDWRGLWMNAFYPYPFESDTRRYVALWLFQQPVPEIVRELPDEAQWDYGSTRSGSSEGKVALGRLWFPHDAALTAVPEMWSSWTAGNAKDRRLAVVRWSPQDIPMPYEARAAATVDNGGVVALTVEFDNLRIIRNDADLWMTVEYFRQGEEEPIPLSDTYTFNYQFQPHETYLYACEYVPVAPPSVDRIRYSLWTTVAWTDGETVSSNVATAEVRLD